MFSFYFYINIWLVKCSAAEASNLFAPYSPQKNYDTPKIKKSDILFDSLNLGKLGLGCRAYDYAMLGYNVLKTKGKLSNDKILSIADLTLPSSKKRLFVIDVKNYKLLFVTYVAHGKKTGLDTALYFSNEPESNKTSVGFYTTLATYTGSHGYSLKLEGHEIGFNSNALHRDIVIHGAKYVNESVVKSQGYLGRSLGCPALSPAIYKAVIDKIKNGTCLFIYGNDARYIMNSKLLKQPVKSESN
ncbi:MAG: murein L,D-transpeptidase catalytic domain family protein [Ginsengibacter sp.]